MFAKVGNALSSDLPTAAAASADCLTNCDLTLGMTLKLVLMELAKATACSASTAEPRLLSSGVR